MTERLITVFGGTGFLGRVIVSRLLEGGARVRVAARHPQSPAGAESGGGGAEPFPADIRDPDAVARAVEGASGVVNAVSLYAQSAAATFEEIHVEGAARVARRAREAGAGTLVHVSGIGVDETSESPYLRSRARGERRVRELFPDAVMLRPSVIFGPDDAFLAAVKTATLPPVVPLFGRGDTRLQPVYVGDVADAAVHALDSPDAAGRIYELGGPDVMTYRAIVERVMSHLGRRRVLMPVPYGAWHMLAGVASLLPGQPLTRDQVSLMEEDNVVGGEQPTFADLGITPRSLDELLASCLPR